MGKSSRQLPERIFGQNFRRWRNQNGVILREVSAKTGFSIAYLSDLENGKRGISLSNAVKLAAFAGHSIGNFLRVRK